MRSFSGLYCPAFGLNAENKNLKNSKYGHFSRNEIHTATLSLITDYVLCSKRFNDLFLLYY